MVAGWGAAMAQPARAGKESGADVVLAVAHFNFDCYRDTVFGVVDAQFHALPTEIHWGAAPANAGKDCASETPEKKRRRVTVIDWPGWSRITGSVAFERMNADSLTDMVLYLWGVDEGPGNGKAQNDRAAARDSLRALVIFGQAGLDGVERITLAAIGAFQAEPYFAMELTPGMELRDERKRDLSGTPSYEVRRVALDVRRKKDTAQHGPSAPPLAGVSMEEAAAVRVYPNPSAGETRVEAERLPAGLYTIEVVAVNGTVVLRQDVAVSETRGLLQALDARELPSGYYLLRLHRDAAGAQAPLWEGSYPVIITR